MVGFKDALQVIEDCGGSDVYATGRISISDGVVTIKEVAKIEKVIGPVKTETCFSLD